MRLPKLRSLLIALTISSTMFAAGAASAAADETATVAATCPAEQTTQPFLPWGDSASYALAPDGDFEQGLAGWAVSGGAGLVAGAEPWSVTDASETQSLDLPEGSAATSPSICLEANDPTIRFFDVNSGDPSSRLSVSLSFTADDGAPVTLPIDVISSDGTWQPSPIVPVLANLLALDGSVPVQFTFTPIGSGDWQIDDLYVDPWGRT